MMEIRYNPIGIVHSPFKETKGTPIQPNAAIGTQATVEIYPEYEEGLQDLDGFSHIILLYHFHLSKFSGLKVKPYMDDNLHGVFATRSPSRPNPIGLSVVRLIKVEKNILEIQNVEIIDGTPVLDIKPYVPEFTTNEGVKIGWLEKNVHKLQESKDDGRFG
ncbi:tRNA (N6-threonylcarbamoyladenosine(37)-N6)-methyltransferase TrmO [Petrotoga sp. DB-2]